MRGREALPDPLFSASGGTTRSADDGPIKTPQLLVDFSAVDLGGPQAVEDSVPRAIGIPFVEQMPHGRPRPEFVGQITPGRAGPENPEDAVEHLPSIAWWTSGRRRWREEAFEQFPLLVRESVTQHPC